MKSVSKTTALRHHPGASLSTIAQGTAIGAGLALVANMVVYTLGNLGSPIRVVTGWSPDGADLRASELIVTTVVSVVAGGLVLWAVERRVNGFRVWTTAAAAVAVLSAVPLYRLDIDTGSQVALSSMHILTGTSAITAHVLVRRRHALSHADLHPSAAPRFVEVTSPR